MRVDGSLMGMDDKRTSLLPQWKRGHFSLLFDGATTPATILLCDHAKKKYLDLSKEKKKHKPSLDDEVPLYFCGMTSSLSLALEASIP